MEKLNANSKPSTTMKTDDFLNLIQVLDSCHNYFDPSEDLTPTGYPFIIKDATSLFMGCFPNQTPNTLYFTIETEDCTDIGIPDRASLYQFVAHVSQEIAQRITDYPNCNPGDDLTMGIQNSLDYLSQLVMLND